jgi:nucleoside-diphosphate-sugar epimerase
MRIYKNKLTNHPRGDISKKKNRGIIIGATGATGSKLVKLLLKSDKWEKVTTISRKPVLEGKSHEKLNEVIINSFDQLDQTFNNWKGHDSFFNCIGTTRKIAGGAKQFVDIEYGISLKSAELANKADIPNASVISASGANPDGFSVDWIHPLLYAKTIGLKEETLTSHYNFNNVSIFRPGMLIRYYDETSSLQQFFHNSNMGLPVSLLASAMKRDSEAIMEQSNKTEAIVYIGNNCIKSSMTL